MKYFKTYEAYRYGVNGVGSLKNSLAALKRQNITGRYVDPETLAQGIRNEYEAITGEKYEDEVQMSMDNTIADIIGHYKLDGPDFMAAWDKVVKESVVNEKETLASAIEKEMDNNRFNVDVEFFTRDLRQIQNTENHKDLHPSIKKVLKALKKKYRIRESELNEFGPMTGSGNRNYSTNDLVDRIGDLDDILASDRKAEREWEEVSQNYLDGQRGSEYWGDLGDQELQDAIDDAESLMKKYRIKESVTEAKGGQIFPGDYVKNQHGNIYLRVDGKVGRHDAYVRVTNGKAGKRKTGLHDSFKLTLVNKDGLEESVTEGTLKISGAAYDLWDEKEVQRKLRDVKIKIIGDIGGVATIKGNDKELQKVKDILGLEGAKESVNEGSDQARLTHLRKFGIAPNNQPQNAAYIKQVSKPGKFFVDWKDAFKLGDVALEFVKSTGSISEFDIIDLKTMKRTGKQLDVKKGQLGNLRTTYGVRVNESVNDASNNLEKIFGTDQETMDMFQGIEDKGTVKDMIEFIDEFGNEEMLSRYGIKSAAQVKKLAKTIMGESMVNEKDFEPHMMYDPKTGKGYKAEKPEDHDRMDKLGYVHEKPEEVTESYKGNFTDFKYDLEMAIDNMDISPKAIKSVKKKGNGYEVRLSSYMNDKSTWEKIGDTIGATLISFKPGSINIGIYE